MRRLFLYHLRLAGKDLRRDAGLTAAIVVGMTIATSIFAVAALHNLRLHGPRPPYAPALHQVELPHPGAFTALKSGSAWTGPLGVRTRVTPAEHAVLAGSGLPVRQTSTFRARLLVGADRKQLHYVRFVTAEFFALFARPFAFGAPFSPDSETAVISLPLGRQLFGDRDPTGQTIFVDGHAYRIAGMLSEHQPSWAEWDISSFGNDQDAVYLPFASARTLRARPELPVVQGAFGPSYDDLLRSTTIYLSHWIELPTPALRAAYARYLDQQLGPNGYTLRDLATWRAATDMPETGARFFFTLTFILLAGGGFNMMRLLLARGLARSEATAIHRALGAPRSAIFTRQMIEAAMMVLPAALMGIVLSQPYVSLWNQLVHDTDVPLRLTGIGALVTGGVAVGVGLLAAIYPAWRLASIKPAISVMRR